MAVLKTDYETIVAQIKAFGEDEPHFVPFFSNISAILWQNMEDLNWAGFYLVTKEDDLVLGPFQGKVACIHIAKGKGVCGTAFEKKEQVLVKNVHDFAGHIACDEASLSEVVTPIFDKEGNIRAVLDIDSPSLERFSKEDGEGLCKICKAISECTDWRLQ